MSRNDPRLPAVLALVASTLGLVFSSYSTFDYAAHLDRQIHAIHCSFIPGASASTDLENACRTAMYSPYSAIFRDKLWGGVPISLFAVGAFAFFVGFSLYFLLAGARAPRVAQWFFGATSVTPLFASLVMFLISAIRLGSFCKLCVGIYVSSALLATAGVLVLRAAQGEAKAEASAPPSRPRGHVAFAALWLALLGAATLLPATAYATSVPDYKPYLASCGKLAVPTEPHNALVKIATARPVQPVTMFVDPLCPTCKALHERLVGEGVFEQLDVQAALFPLDNDCNWMLDRPLHAGACVLAKAVLCGGARGREVLEWSYANQEELRIVGKTGNAPLKAMVVKQFGADMGACLDTRATQLRLNQHLQYAVANHVPVSTPQVFLGEKRLCDEDTDLGLRYTLGQLAPQVLP